MESNFAEIWLDCDENVMKFRDSFTFELPFASITYFTLNLLGFKNKR